MWLENGQVIKIHTRSQDIHSFSKVAIDISNMSQYAFAEIIVN